MGEDGDAILGMGGRYVPAQQTGTMWYFEFSYANSAALPSGGVELTAQAQSG